LKTRLKKKVYITAIRTQCRGCSRPEALEARYEKTAVKSDYDIIIIEFSNFTIIKFCNIIKDIQISCYLLITSVS